MTSRRSAAPLPDAILAANPGLVEPMEVMVEALPGLEGDRRQGLAAELEGRIKGRIGVSAAVSIVDPGAIERSQGKARRVVDKRPKS